MVAEGMVQPCLYSGEAGRWHPRDCLLPNAQAAPRTAHDLQERSAPESRRLSKAPNSQLPRASCPQYHAPALQNGKRGREGGRRGQRRREGRKREGGSERKERRTAFPSRPDYGQWDNPLADCTLLCTEASPSVQSSSRAGLMGLK